MYSRGVRFNWFDGKVNITTPELVEFFTIFFFFRYVALNTAFLFMECPSFWRELKELNVVRYLQYFPK